MAGWGSDVKAFTNDPTAGQRIISAASNLRTEIAAGIHDEAIRQHADGCRDAIGRLRTLADAAAADTITVGTADLRTLLAMVPVPPDGRIRPGMVVSDNEPWQQGKRRMTVRRIVEDKAVLGDDYGETRVRLDRIHTDGKPRRSGWSVVQ